MDFLQKLEKAQEKNNSLVCVGLDPNPEKTAPKTFFEFNKKIIDLTAPFVSCFKPQIAFYEAQGGLGIDQLKRTVDYLRESYPQIPIICDAKRSDIGSSSQMYASQLFDFLKVDAATVNPYLGFDSLEPFFERKEKGIIVLCRTSNPSASDFQDLKVGAEPLYLKVAEKVVDWNKHYKNLLLVVGATWPKEIIKIRKIAPEMTFLVPGIGAQGGDLETTLKNGLRKDKKGLIISASRSIIYAQEPQTAAKKLRDDINKYR